MSRSLYQDLVLDHYKNPRNYGDLEEFDIETEVSNPNCGDELRFRALVRDGEVVKLRFQGTGCALSIAGASRLAEHVEGKSMEAVKRIGAEELFALLGLSKDEVSPMRHKCVALAHEALAEMGP